MLGAFFVSCLFLGTGVARGESQADSPEQSADGSTVRISTEKGCQVSVSIGETKYAGDLDEGQVAVAFRNSGPNPVWEVLLVLKADPMSYWGVGPGALSVFPDGRVDLFFAGDGGEPFLRAGQEKIIPIFRGAGGGDFAVERSACATEDIFAELKGRMEVAERFGQYAPYAESSLRSLFLSPAGWNDILSTSGAKGDGGGVRRYFFSHIADSCLSSIATGVSMVASSGGAAPEYQKGYLAESYFDEAKKAFEAGNLDGAVGFLEKVLVFDPANPMVLNNLAYIRLKRGDGAAEVRPYIEQALKVDPTQPSFQNTMSILLKKEGRDKEAIEMARAAHRGSKGEIPETRANIIEWGGEVPDVQGGDAQDGGKGVGKPGEKTGGGGVSTSERLPDS